MRTTEPTPSEGIPITPAEFARRLEGVALHDVWLEALAADVEDHAAFRRHKHHAAVRRNFSFENAEPDAAVGRVAYEVTLRRDPDRATTARFSFTVAVLYRVRTPFDDEFFRIFVSNALTMHAQPYARAWLQDLTLRMGLPPLVLPLQGGGARRGKRPTGEPNAPTRRRTSKSSPAGAKDGNGRPMPPSGSEDRSPAPKGSEIDDATASHPPSGAGED